VAVTIVKTATGTSALATTTPAFTAGGTATANNLILGIVASDDYRSAVPSGFTESTGMRQETFLGAYLWWKVAAGGETGLSYTIGSASPSAWGIAEISGLTATPYDISAGQFAASSGGTYTTPAITPTAGDRFLVGLIGGSISVADPAGVDTWLNSFVEFLQSFTSLGSGTRDIAAAASVELTADGVTAYSTGASFNAGLQSMQARVGMTIAFKVASAGTAFTRTVDDSAGLTDSTAAASAREAAATDTAGLTDQATGVSAFARAQTDTAGLTDPRLVVSAFARASTDSAGLTDAATPVLTPAGTAFTRTVDDGTGLTDTGDPLALDVAETVTDSAGLVDTLAAAVTFVRSVTDAAGLTDTATPLLAGSGTRLVDDSAGLTDAVTYSSTQTLTDSAGLTDATTRVLTATRTITDAAGLTDSVTVTQVRAAAVTDSAGLSDSASAQLNASTVHARTVTDSVGLRSYHRQVCTTRRPNSGVTVRPNSGTTPRYALVPD
jgi:hypothetical protein